MFSKQSSTDDMAKCCALCEHSIKLEFQERYLCKYKNNIAETEAEDFCKHFEPDLLKLEPKPRKRYIFEN